jgi:hypothetical protein
LQDDVAEPTVVVCEDLFTVAVDGDDGGFVFGAEAGVADGFVDEG